MPVMPTLDDLAQIERIYENTLCAAQSYKTQDTCFRPFQGIYLVHNDSSFSESCLPVN